MTYLNKHLLERSTLKIVHGHRYAFVGQNGVGKSTLLKRIDSGSLPGFPHHLRTVLVQQEAPLSEESELSSSVMEAVLASDERVLQLKAKEEQFLGEGGSDMGSKLEEIYVEMEAFGGFSGEQRAVKLLTALGFTDERMAISPSQLSGGWRSRLGIACALFSEPDILLLDEPTVHLDISGILWLTQKLVNMASSCIIVSHDRAFLDATCTDVIHFDQKQLKYYPGNYSVFEMAKAEANLHLNREEEKILKTRKAIEQSIHNMTKAAAGKKGDQKKSSLVASRRKKLDRLGIEKDEYGHRFKCQTNFVEFGSAIRRGAVNENALGFQNRKMTRRSVAPPCDRAITFKFPSPSELGVSTETSILQIRGLGCGYTDGNGDDSTIPTAAPPHYMLFEGLDAELTLSSRIALVGRNGCGKSSLLWALASLAEENVVPRATLSMQPRGLKTKGSVIVMNGVRIGFFTQHMVESIHTNPEHREQTPIVFFIDSISLLQHRDLKEQDVRACLGSFGVGADLVHKPLHSLSSGQKARVALAIIAELRPHIIVLDEPGNFLDLHSVEAIIHALQGYEGGVLLVSHDRDFITQFANDVWIVKKSQRKVDKWKLEDFEAYVHRLELKSEKKHYHERG